MSIIINSLDIVDANGISLTESVKNFKSSSALNQSAYIDEPVAGLAKFDSVITDQVLDSELKELGFTEAFNPRQVKLAVLAALRACKNLKLPQNTAVIGTTLEGSSETKAEVLKSLEAKKSRVSPRICATATSSTICTTISRTLKINGPSLMITQACSGFITALNIASKFLDSNTCDVALVVGVESTTPISAYLFKSTGVYTTSSVMPFDVNRTGMALGEGAVCYVVTRQDSAQDRIASIKKISLYNDFYNLTSPNPDGSAASFLLTELGAFDNQVDSINCHATSTKVGDDIELKALDNLPYTTDVFGLKGRLGHTLAASAGIEAAYSIMGMHEGWVPYTSATTSPLPTKHNVVLGSPKERANNNFIKLSFGFGGVSAGMLVEK